MSNFKIDNIDVSDICRLSSMSGSSNYSTKMFPRLSGVLIKPSGYVEKSMTISGSWVLPAGHQGRNNVEKLQYSIVEKFARMRNVDVYINGAVINNCMVDNISFQESTDPNFLNYTFIIGFGDNSTQKTMTCGSGSAGRHAVFTPKTDAGVLLKVPFNFLHKSDQTASFSNNIGKMLKTEASDEPRLELSGGAIQVTSLASLIGIDQKNIANFMCNAITYCAGKVGKLQYAGMTFDDVFCSGIQTSGIGVSWVDYTGTFILSVRC